MKVKERKKKLLKDHSKCTRTYQSNHGAENNKVRSRSSCDPKYTSDDKGCIPSDPATLIDGSHTGTVPKSIMYQGESPGGRMIAINHPAMWRMISIR